MLTRLARRPLWAHAAALAIVLVALMAFVRTDASYYSDEGQAIIQAQHLAAGDGWLVPAPIPQADPTNASYPLSNSNVGTKGIAPLAKHPTYPLLLAAADRIGGVPAMVALSVLGTLAAGLLAAILAGRLLPALAVPALWMAGAGSPLLFDGYLVAAHTLAAAAVAAALLVALAAAAPGARGARWAGAVALVAALALVAGMLRTEAVLLGPALAFGLVAGARRDGRRRVLLPAAALFVGALAAHVVDARWAGAIVGRAAASAVPASLSGTGSFWQDRVQAAALSVLSPGYGGATTGAVLIVGLATALGVVVLALGVVRGAPDHRLAAGAAVVAAAVATARAVVEPATVPGLLLAFPLLVVGLTGWRQRPPSTAPGLARTLALAAGAFFVLVGATQYADAGGVEWGGRYFAVGLPLVVPLLVAGLASLGAALPLDRRPVMATAMVVVVVMLSLAGLRELRSTRAATAAFVDAIDRAASTSGPQPVIIATNPFVPRSAYRTFARQRWLLARPDDASLLGRLHEAGISVATVVTANPEADRALLSAARQRAVVGTYEGWQLIQVTTG